MAPSTKSTSFAVDRINARIVDQSSLREVIRDGNLSSCALTAGALGKIASDNAPLAVQGLFPMAPNERVNAIDDKLDLGYLVAVSISPDHHFIVLPYENDNIAILQGFQDVYTFVEWRDACGEMKVNRQFFTNAMLRLTGPVKSASVEAAAALFAYGTIGDHLQTAKGRNVEHEVRNYFSKPGPTQITNISYQVI